jgi:phosphoribosylformimino-5-aminoimidazole carboxamide ribotide isomerase
MPIESTEYPGEAMIYPSIDLMNGKAVQLVQGRVENKKLEIEDVMALALKFSKIGPINVIDLDAALEQGGNEELIKVLTRTYPVRVGGGIRSLQRAEAYIDAGAEKIIIGSKAFDLNFLQNLTSLIGPEKIMIALDSFGDEIVIRGWTQKTAIKTEEMILKWEPYCSEFLYTQVEKEGLMMGPDFKRLKRLRKLTDHALTAAGGISSLEDIVALEKEGINSVLGMALYTGKIIYEDLVGKGFT